MSNLVLMQSDQIIIQSFQAGVQKRTSIYRVGKKTSAKTLLPN